MIDIEELKQEFTKYTTSCLDNRDALELIDRLQAAESERDTAIKNMRKAEERLSQRTVERDQLKSKFAEIEKQEPYDCVVECNGKRTLMRTRHDAEHMAHHIRETSGRDVCVKLLYLHAKPVPAEQVHSEKAQDDPYALIDLSSVHPAQAVAIPEERNITKCLRSSDQSVMVVFNSCRAASVFRVAIESIVLANGGE